MKGILRQSEESKHDFFVEYEGQWQQSTIDLMVANGDDPQDFKCIKDVTVHPEDVEMFLDYPNMIETLVDREIDFDFFILDSGEKCGTLNFN